MSQTWLGAEPSSRGDGDTACECNALTVALWESIYPPSEATVGRFLATLETEHP